MSDVAQLVLYQHLTSALILGVSHACMYKCHLTCMQYMCAICGSYTNYFKLSTG